jgi:regulator of RNase E activity RraA
MGHPHGGYIPDLSSYSPNKPTKIVGPAFTVKVGIPREAKNHTLSDDTSVDGQRQGQGCSKAGAAFCEQTISTLRNSTGAVTLHSQVDAAEEGSIMVISAPPGMLREQVYCFDVPADHL